MPPRFEAMVGTMYGYFVGIWERADCILPKWVDGLFIARCVLRVGYIQMNPELIDVGINSAIAEHQRRRMEDKEQAPIYSPACPAVVRPRDLPSVCSAVCPPVSSFARASAISPSIRPSFSKYLISIAELPKPVLVETGLGQSTHSPASF